MACSDSQISQWLQLWAKTRDRSDQNRAYHPLLYHMLDVAAVAGLVWDNCFVPQLRKRLEYSLDRKSVV